MLRDFQRISQELRQMPEKKQQEKDTVPQVAQTISAEEFAKKFPTSHRTGGRSRSQRIQLAVETVSRMLQDKQKGYVVIENDPFFGSGIASSLRKQLPKAENIIMHWFDMNDADTKAEVSKHPKQESRYLVQIELV